MASEQVGIEEPQSHYSTKHVLKGACETQTVFLAAQFLLNNITVQGVAIFTPTIVATIFPDVNSVRKNLFTVPPYMAGAASTLLMPYLSMRYKKRGVFLGVEGLLMM